MELTPLVNHWWNIVFHVTSRGLQTAPIPHAGRIFDIVFDFIDHRLLIQTSDGETESLDLVPMTVSDFYFAFMERLKRLGIDVHIWTMPSEIENAVPFDKEPCAFPIRSPTMRNASGGRSSKPTGCSRFSAPVSSARRVPYISSGQF